MLSNRALPYFLFPLSLFALTAHSQTAARASDSDPRIPTFASLASEARQRGRSEVMLSPPYGIPPFNRGLLDGLSTYSAVLATPLLKETFVEPHYIFTCYELRIDRVLVNHPVVSRSLTAGSLAPEVKSSRLWPIVPGEALLCVNGGVTVVDGVNITMRDPADQPIRLNQQYFFVVDISGDNIAQLPFEAAGVFSVGGDGQTLSPTTLHKHPIVEDVNSPALHSLSLIERRMQEQKDKEKLQ